MFKLIRYSPWFFFCAFLLLAASTWIGVNLLFKPIRILSNGPFWMYFYRDLDQEEPVDIFFIGNSHSQFTFVPEIIDDLLGTRSISLNTSAEPIQITQYVYREILARHDPLAVVVETYTITGGRNREQTLSWMFSFFDSMPLSIKQIQYSQDFAYRENRLEALFPFLSYRSSWKNMPGLIEDFQGVYDRLDTPLILEHQGYINASAVLSPAKWEIEKSYRGTFNLDEINLNERLSILQDMIARDKDDPSQLIFMEAPQIIEGDLNYKGLIREQLSSANQPYYPLLIDQGEYPHLWFYNATHMSTFGAMQASLEAAVDLSQALNLPIDQQAMTDYRAFLFNAYTVSEKDGQATLTLLPTDGMASKELLYHWEIVQANEPKNILMSSDSRGTPQISFSVIPCEETLIRVWISHPNLDFVLEGEFSYIGGDDGLTGG